jgi:hypothetical protein
VYATIWGRKSLGAFEESEQRYATTAIFFKKNWEDQKMEFIGIYGTIFGLRGRCEPGDINK